MFSPMKTTATVLQMLIRITGVILIILGGLFWSHSALQWMGLHMILGFVLVIALWMLAFLGARAGVSAGMVSVALVWGLVVVIVGVKQTSLMPGSAHWVIQVVHLVLGLGAMGLGEALGARIKRRAAVA